MAKARKFSFTMLNTFDICPWKFRWNYVLYNKEPSTPEMEEGNRVHKEFEDMFGGRKEPTPFVQRYVEALADIRAPRATYTEKQLGMKEDGVKTTYGSPDVFYRAKMDLLVVPPVGKGTTAYNIDWKTGNPKYPKMEQLSWSDLLVLANFPHVDRIASRLIFIGTKGERLVPDDAWQVTHRNDTGKIWDSLNEAVARVRLADETGVFQKMESPLCAYCAVKDCPNHGR